MPKTYLRCGVGWYFSFLSFSAVFFSFNFVSLLPEWLLTHSLNLFCMLFATDARVCVYVCVYVWDLSYDYRYYSCCALFPWIRNNNKWLQKWKLLFLIYFQLLIIGSSQRTIKKTPPQPPYIMWSAKKAHNSENHRFIVIACVVVDIVVVVLGATAAAIVVVVVIVSHTSQRNRIRWKRE